MGNKPFKALSKHKDLRILMLGLDAAGKTTTLFKLKLGKVVKTTPTLGFNVERVNFKTLTFTVWDIGGQESIRNLWRHYYKNTAGLVYVVDSSDRLRVDDSASELTRMLKEDDLIGVPVMVLANKQDLPDALSSAELVEKFNLSALSDRQWHVQPACAISGDGLEEGLQWLANSIKAKSKKK
mmetsp:Transcript_1339/g.1513  ORF Transcript_1339/g.1513 Transcript_1339/m.1513 type:complete len:182 (-) Transcript_1339:42-587(-)